LQPGTLGFDWLGGKNPAVSPTQAHCLPPEDRAYSGSLIHHLVWQNKRMRMKAGILSATVVTSLLLAVASRAADAAAEWKQLFNGRDLEGWDTYVAAPSGSKTPFGLNNDPRRVFEVTNTGGATAIHVSGEIYGAITTRDAFTNFHVRVEFKWGEKRWPPRANVGRDSGILYCGVGEPNPHTGWLTSVENNIMEKGVGQWWSVNGAVIDVEGEWITPAMEPKIPYKKEGSGEKNIVYRKGAPRIPPALPMASRPVSTTKNRAASGTPSRLSSGPDSASICSTAR
jgi:tetrahydromethanopterin S-methyltransferase subunit G